METLGSHFCPTCNRQVATTLVELRGKRDWRWLGALLILIAITAALTPFLIGLIFIPHVLRHLFYPTTYGYRCDFCGKLMSE